MILYDSKVRIIFERVCIIGCVAAQMVHDGQDGDKAKQAQQSEYYALLGTRGGGFLSFHARNVRPSGKHRVEIKWDKVHDI